MTYLYSWDASVPGRAGGGLTHEETAAKAAAVTWMLAHGADSAVVDRVCLASSFIGGYVPTAYRLVARRRGDNEIAWTTVCTEETELAAS